VIIERRPSAHFGIKKYPEEPGYFFGKDMFFYCIMLVLLPCLMMIFLNLRENFLLIRRV
jgi:hypothetical protein